MKLNSEIVLDDIIEKIRPNGLSDDEIIARAMKITKGKCNIPILLNRIRTQPKENKND